MHKGAVLGASHVAKQACSSKTGLPRQRGAAARHPSLHIRRVCCWTSALIGGNSTSSSSAAQAAQCGTHLQPPRPLPPRPAHPPPACHTLPSAPPGCTGCPACLGPERERQARVGEGQARVGEGQARVAVRHTCRQALRWGQQLVDAAAALAAARRRAAPLKQQCRWNRRSASCLHLPHHALQVLIPLAPRLEGGPRRTVLRASQGRHGYCVGSKVEFPPFRQHGHTGPGSAQPTLGSGGGLRLHTPVSS